MAWYYIDVFLEPLFTEAKHSLGYDAIIYKGKHSTVSLMVLSHSMCVIIVISLNRGTLKSIGYSISLLTT